MPSSPVARVTHTLARKARRTRSVPYNKNRANRNLESDMYLATCGPHGYKTRVFYLDARQRTKPSKIILRIPKRVASPKKSKQHSSLHANTAPVALPKPQRLGLPWNARSLFRGSRTAVALVHVSVGISSGTRTISVVPNKRLALHTS